VPGYLLTALCIIANIENPAVISKILAHLDEKVATVETAQLPPCRAPPCTGLLICGEELNCS
jgi:hypothetical protein